MKIILTLIFLSLISGCATRTKVYANKKSSDRWIKVDAPKDFLTAEELKFFNIK